MKKSYIILAIIISVITALAISYLGSSGEEIAEEEKPVIVDIGGRQLQVTVADTDAKRSKGLGGVESLSDNEGMLFIFERQKNDGGFWMKGMKMSIDIIWINDGKVAQIHPSLSAPEAGTSDRDLALFIPNDPYDQVLEVRAGWTEEFGVEVGDSVNFNL